MKFAVAGVEVVSQSIDITATLCRLFSGFGDSDLGSVLTGFLYFLEQILETIAGLSEVAQFRDIDLQILEKGILSSEEISPFPIQLGKIFVGLLRGDGEVLTLGREPAMPLRQGGTRVFQAGLRGHGKGPFFFPGEDPRVGPGLIEQNFALGQMFDFEEAIESSLFGDLDFAVVGGANLIAPIKKGKESQKAKTQAREKQD